ncbi:MAG: circadian clock KaiB family protein [Stagnimonas sp.]|nr:circadian clock KaiB family protein [Stagnimonas sp.]
MTPENGRSSKARPPAGPPTTSMVVLCLYVVDQAPNSVQAVANLEAICQRHLKGKFKLEIIDVIEFPQHALDNGVIVTPCLAKLSPSPTARIIGNLSDTDKVMRALGIPAASGP